MIDLAAPMFIADRDPGDEHSYPRIYALEACPECGASREPEPSDAERSRLFADPDFAWSPPEGDFLWTGFGLMGGGYGLYVVCDRCGFLLKEQSDE